MGEICVRSDFMLSLLSEVGKARALAPHETDVIEDCIAQELIPFRWNPRLDNALLIASHSPGGIARFARRHQITRQMADSRLYRLRQQQKRKAARKGREA
jgi:hypothetical protein